MPQLGIWELLVILVIVLLIFGVGRLGKLGRDLGEGIREFQKGIRPESDGSEKPAEEAGAEKEEA